MTVRPTRRGIAVLVLAVLLVACGQWAGFPLLRALGGMLLAAVLAAVAVTARRVRVTVTRSVYPDRIERGKPALARLRVRNPVGTRQPAFLATDTAGGATQTVRIRPLQPAAEATYHYELAVRARGKVTVGPLLLHRVDPFGLATNRLPTGETATLWVHPRQFPARALVSAHLRHHHEGATTDDPLRGSMDLRDVREYVPGDEVRHLHWKATARTGRLMVRDLADPQQPRFTVLLDTRLGAFSPQVFEEAVDLAASLLAASARAGQHSRLVTSSGLDVPTPGGTLAARSLLDALSELARGDGEALVPGALSASRGFGGCLAVVTSAGSEMSSLAWLRHRYSAIFVFALGGDGRGARAVTGARVLVADNAEQAVRRWNEVIG
ncbi:hypothetical protein GCM10011581_38500 [Saccharopolyspora subtropica]|uniref:DUF58 domain-containing protein n=1 Tax=Saccharopolyspora thermophila TaxID=89367 RepID=A0A917NFD2_9PSEU|nr:DUF58 domain-containing protein [Saccharopolyspora subtropica]GGI97675.1 hypothetical protein GCM10011581_38500 [Saccharopolyspora subtropica]